MRPSPKMLDVQFTCPLCRYNRLDDGSSNRMMTSQSVSRQKLWKNHSGATSHLSERVLTRVNAQEPLHIIYHQLPQSLTQHHRLIDRWWWSSGWHYLCQSRWLRRPWVRTSTLPTIIRAKDASTPRQLKRNYWFLSPLERALCNWVLVEGVCFVDVFCFISLPASARERSLKHSRKWKTISPS
jgi:hypothetical protein